MKTGILMRQSGIDVIGDVPGGWSVSQFFQGREDLVEVLVPYFFAGLKNKEFCLWITGEFLPAEDAKAALCRTVPDLEEYLRSGQMEIIESDRRHSQSKALGPKEILQGWIEKAKQAGEKGFDGTRLTQDLSWITGKEWEYCEACEKGINEKLKEYNILAVCSYDLNRCGVYRALESASYHRLALIKEDGAWRAVENRQWKVLEDSLRESEHRCSVLFENTGNPGFIVDMEGRYLDCNRSALEFLECSREELLSGSVRDFAPPEKKEQVFVEHKALWVKDGAATVETEYFIRGKTKIVELTVVPFIWKGKRVIFESGKEITVRKAALAKLNGELNKFKVLCDLAVNMSAVKPLDENLAFIVERSRGLFNADTSFIALLDDESKGIKMHVFSGIRTEEFKQMRLLSGKGLGGLVMQERKGYIVENYFTDTRILHAENPLVAGEGIVSGMAVPIQSGEKNFGVLYVFNRLTTSFTGDDLATLTLLGNLAAIEIMNKNMHSYLRESGQRMSSIIDFLPDATVVIDKEGRVIAWNKAIEKITGIPAADILGRGGYEHGKAFYGDPRPILADLVFQPDRELENKYPFLKREGETLFGENYVPSCWGGKGAFLWGTARLLRDTDGNIAGAIESTRDITEWKTAEEKLHSQLIFLQTLLDTIPNPVFYKDRQGKYLGCNKAFEDLFGIREEDVVGKTVYEVSPEDIADKYFEKDNELFGNPGKQEYEWKVRCNATGGIKTAVFNQAAFMDINGNMAGLIGVISDITERKQMELDLHEKMRDLEIFHKVAVDRELRLKELKKRIKDLESQLQQN
ncbi:MAG: PAS domain S-box protein [Candidatus Omnitrophica bacterium]|nr:PAS domain S-box protein [Candidatus Omnitrophota bacterium]